MRSLRWLSLALFVAAAGAAWQAFSMFFTQAHFGSPLLQTCASARSAEVLRDCAQVRAQVVAMTWKYGDAMLFVVAAAAALAVAAVVLLGVSLRKPSPA